MLLTKSPLYWLFFSLFTFTVQASENDQNTPFDKCLIEQVKNSDKTIVLKRVESLCEEKLARKMIHPQDSDSVELGALSLRFIQERRSADNPFVITPHEMNYVLPVSISSNINNNIYEEVPNWQDNLVDNEAKFQVSFKVPLVRSILHTGDSFYFAFTLQSWWQIYSNDISKPFRETNYKPEFFYIAPTPWHPFGGNSAFMIGAEHQSNGQSQLLSRSWNRVYANFIYEKNNAVLSLKPWYRISESEKETPTASEGDDNPDILDYMGYFELTLAYKLNNKYDLSIKTRENVAEHHGFVELGFTFPLWGKLKGYAQYSNGYGESLIDYNYNQHRFSIGIALTDIL